MRARKAHQVHVFSRSRKQKILTVAIIVMALTILSFFSYTYLLKCKGGKLKAESRQKLDKLQDISSSSASGAARLKSQPIKELVKIKPLASNNPQQSSQKSQVLVAWQPSHQNDTGPNWHEYIICGDIVDKTMAKAANVQNVKCWDLTHGLTGSNNYRPNPINTIAFDSEIEQANQVGASYFISIHNDGGAPSGVLGEYLPDDDAGKKLAGEFVNSICAKTGLPNRGLRAVQLYSLESSRNKAQYKCLLEIGDNEKDRIFLENCANRDKVAQSLAEVSNGLGE